MLMNSREAVVFGRLGEKIPAATALDWGLIWQVVPDADLAAMATALARRLAAGPTASYALIRRGIRQCMDASLTEALAIERRHQLLAGRTADFAEGVAAFLHKRPVNFTGR